MSIEGKVLLGALLDRMGKAQAQALLVRLEQWLSEEARTTSPRSTLFDRDQPRAIEAAYDRRKQTENPKPGPNPSSASERQKDTQS